MAIRQLLEETVGILNSISVPVAMADNVSRPILRCVRNINECIRMIPDDEEHEETELHNGNEYGE